MGKVDVIVWFTCSLTKSILFLATTNVQQARMKQT